MMSQYSFPEAFGSAAEVGLGFLFGFLLVIYLLIVSYAVAGYILQSIGLYTIAKRRGIHKPWLAWIPIGNVWILGSISDQYRYVVRGEVRNRRKLLMGLTIALMAVSFVTAGAESAAFLGSMGMTASNNFAAGLLVMVFGLAFWGLAVVATVFQYICYFDLFRSCQPKKLVLHFVLSLLITPALPIIVFLSRHKDEGMPPRRKTPEPVVQELVQEVVDADFAEEIPAQEIVEETPDSDEVVESDFVDETEE